jgi:aldose 1-epimerase
MAGGEVRSGPVTITDGESIVTIRPDLGCGLERYDFKHQPMFRRAEPGVTKPFDLGLILLAPFSNRISGGGFSFDGRFHRLEPNVPGEAFPIHGGAFGDVFGLNDRDPASASFTALTSGAGPYEYRVDVEYALRSGALDVDMRIRNQGEIALPFGGGLHPWLPRTPLCSLQAFAKRVQLQDERYLPAGFAPIGEHKAWNFKRARPLPDGWINNCFSGWNGQAVIRWPERRMELHVASIDAEHFIVYSPGADADFFCFEPVTHVIDAHNLPGGPAQHGLVILKPGHAIAFRCGFIPAPIA